MPIGTRAEEFGWFSVVESVCLCVSSWQNLNFETATLVGTIRKAALRVLEECYMSVCLDDSEIIFSE